MDPESGISCIFGRSEGYLLCYPYGYVFLFVLVWNIYHAGAGTIPGRYGIDEGGINETEDHLN